MHRLLYQKNIRKLSTRAGFSQQCQMAHSRMCFLISYKHMWLRLTLTLMLMQWFLIRQRIWITPPRRFLKTGSAPKAWHELKSQNQGHVCVPSFPIKNPRHSGFSDRWYPNTWLWNECWEMKIIKLLAETILSAPWCSAFSERPLFPGNTQRL